MNGKEYTYQYVSNRGISQDTMRFYDVQSKVDTDGVPLKIAFNYGNSCQVRGFNDKTITTLGNSSESALFGQDKFSPGQNESITITEGAYDAMSAYEMLGSRRPVVSVRSASQARKDCEKARDYLNGFSKIYICFDGDNAGETAVREVALLFDPNKVYHVRLSKYKDANEYHQKMEQKEFLQVWQNSKPYMPKDIVASWDEVDKLLRMEEAPTVGSYPFKTLQEMAYGIRSGEYVLFTAQEKVGKTEVLRAIEHHLLKTTDLNMGVIHLEETEKRSIQGLVGYELMVPVHLPDSGVSVTDVSNVYRKLTTRDGRLHFYAHFGSDDPSLILDVIRYLVTVRNCKFIFLDHITMLVTGFEDDDERRKLDYLSTRFAMMTRELDFTLFMVSHVNDDGKTRGSRNIAKVADLIVNLERDIEAPDLDTRNKTYMVIRGSRFAGRTGPAGVLWFDDRTFTLKEMEITDAQDSSLRDFKEGSGTPPLFPPGF
jgi:twinkle protein